VSSGLENIENFLADGHSLKLGGIADIVYGTMSLQTAAGAGT
jgi:hypothetical protein